MKIIIDILPNKKQQNIEGYGILKHLEIFHGKSNNIKTKMPIWSRVLKVIIHGRINITRDKLREWAH